MPLYRPRQWRPLRHVFLSPRIWRHRLVFWAGAIAIGVVASLFAWVCDGAQGLFGQLRHWAPWAPLIVTPAATAVAALMARQFFPGSQGSGIPQAIAARDRTRPDLRERLLSPRIAAGKMALCGLGLLGGASIGREGTTVQVGAAIMVFAGRLGGTGRVPGLILAGSAAGIAAAFNAPLAGVMFVIEEMSRSFEQRTSTLVLVAVVFAGLTAETLSGNIAYFGETAASLHWLAGWGWLAVIGTGLAGGALGALFARLMIFLSHALPRLRGGVIGRYPVAFAAACGLAIAVIGVAGGGVTYGTGYAQSRLALAGGLTHAATFTGLKLAATLLSSICGIPGGLFSPSISVGAGVGATMAPFFPHIAPGAIVLLGMVAYFTGVVQAPITAFVIVIEMSDNHTMAIPLIAAAMIAYGVSRAICPHPLYHALAEAYLATPPASPDAR